MTDEKIEVEILICYTHQKLSFGVYRVVYFPLLTLESHEF